MIPELTLQENSQYGLLLSMAKQAAEPRATIKQSAYVERTAKQLVEEQGLSPSDAWAAAEMRCRRNGTATLHEKDLIHFRKAGMVPVRDVLADPARYHLQSCADPLEPEEGISRAILYSNPDGSVILSSRLHGGQAFTLRRADGTPENSGAPNRKTYSADAADPAGAGSGADWFREKMRSGGVGRFLDHQPPPLDFVSQNSLMAKTTGLIPGPGGAGKTNLFLHIGAAVATGRDILPGLFTPTGPGKVLILVAEDDEAVMHHRFAALVKELFPFDEQAMQLLRQNLKIESVTGHDVRLITEKGEPTPFFGNVLATLAEYPGQRLIILDPLSRWYGGGENDNALGTFFISLLEQVAHTTGAAVIASHHVTKKAGYTSKGEFSLEEAMSQDVARGASGLTNAVRWQLNLFPLPESAAKKLLGVKEAKSGQYLAAKVSKKNYGPPEQVHFLERGWGGVFTVAAPAEQRMAEDLAKTARSMILNAVTACEGRQLTARNLIRGHLNEWKATDSRITNTVMEDALAACLVHMEIFEREGKNAKGRTITYLSRFEGEKSATIN